MKYHIIQDSQILLSSTKINLGGQRDTDVYYVIHISK